METTTERIGGLDKLHGRIDDAQRLIRWKLSTDRRLKRCAMSVGGFREVEQEVFVSLLSRDVPREIAFSAWVLNNTRWTIARMLERKGKSQALYPPELPYSVEDNSERIERLELEEAVAMAVRELNDDRVEDMLVSNFRGETQSVIGKRYKVTKTRVSQLVLKAIDRMKRPDISRILVEHLTT